MKVGQCCVIAAVSPVSTPRSTSTVAPSSTSHSSFTSPVHLSTGLVAATISRPALAVSTHVAMMCSSSESLIIRWRSASTIDSCAAFGCAIG